MYAEGGAWEYKEQNQMAKNWGLFMLHTVTQVHFCSHHSHYRTCGKPHHLKTHLRKLRNIVEALGELRMTSCHFWNSSKLRTKLGFVPHG